jgi:hypothetical protein
MHEKAPHQRTLGAKLLDSPLTPYAHYLVLLVVFEFQGPYNLLAELLRFLRLSWSSGRFGRWEPRR